MLSYETDVVLSTRLFRFHSVNRTRTKRVVSIALNVDWPTSESRKPMRRSAYTSTRVCRTTRPVVAVFPSCVTKSHYARESLRTLLLLLLLLSRLAVKTEYITRSDAPHTVTARCIPSRPRSRLPARAPRFSIGPLGKKIHNGSGWVRKRVSQYCRTVTFHGTPRPSVV